MKYCKNCGTQLEDNANFCENCGVQQEEQIVAVQEASATEKVRETSGEEGSSEKNDTDAKKRKSSLLPMGIIGAILVIGVIFAGVQLAGNKNESKKTEATKAIETTADTATTAATTAETKQQTQAANSVEMNKYALEAYKEVLRKEPDRTSTYVIGDIDANGISEMIIMTGGSEAERKWNIYAYNDARVNIIGSIGGGHSSVCMKHDGIYSLYGQMGGMEISKLVWDKNAGSLKQEQVYFNENVDNYNSVIASMGLTVIEPKLVTDLSLVGGKIERTEARVTATPVPSGWYIPDDYGSGEDEPAPYSFQVFNSTSSGFDFKIYAYGKLVFRHHTAVFTSSNTAVYYGQNYTLTFRWSRLGEMQINGFEERVPSNAVLINPDYLGVG